MKNYSISHRLGNDTDPIHRNKVLHDPKSKSAACIQVEIGHLVVILYTLDDLGT